MGLAKGFAPQDSLWHNSFCGNNSLKCLFIGSRQQNGSGYFPSCFATFTLFRSLSLSFSRSLSLTPALSLCLVFSFVCLYKYCYQNKSQNKRHNVSLPLQRVSPKELHHLHYHHFAHYQLWLLS